MPTILVTGFGPFPGAPFNPTGPLVQRLARTHLARTKIVTHIFETSYAAVDHDLPKLIARYRPDALLMFGLATNAKTLRIEMRARNALKAIADATGKSPRQLTIAAGKAPAMAMQGPVRHLLAAARSTRLPVELSGDAGGYLCNYLCWRAAELAAKRHGPRLAAFVHVPLVFTATDLLQAGTRVLVALAAAIRR
jgi:pyroglutamyl-peptidase